MSRIFLMLGCYNMTREQILSLNVRYELHCFIVWPLESSVHWRYTCLFGSLSLSLRFSPALSS